jgi:hypothetical protein
MSLRLVGLAFALLDAGARHWRNMTSTPRCCSRGCGSGRETSGRMVPTQQRLRAHRRPRTLDYGGFRPALGRSTWGSRNCSLPRTAEGGRRRENIPGTRRRLASAGLLGALERSHRPALRRSSPELFSHKRQTLGSSSSRFLGAGILEIWAKKVEGAYCEGSPRHLRPGRKAHMKTLPESSRVVRCMRCRDPINQPIGGDGQSATHCARCAPTIASRESRIDRIRGAALAAKAARMRALPPLPNRSGLRHV